MNVKNDDINALYEEYYNANNSSSENKIKSDLWKDFAVLYIMHIVEDNFDNEHTYLFKLKTLIPNMTYKTLQKKTNIKSSRQKVVTVKNWVKENISKDDVNKAFQRMYGNLL